MCLILWFFFNSVAQNILVSFIIFYLNAMGSLPTQSVHIARGYACSITTLIVDILIFEGLPVTCSKFLVSTITRFPVQ